MRVSVVMAACNPGPLLHRTVEEIKKASRGVEYEIIVVNDQSEDGECEKLDKTVKVLNPPMRIGCSGARHMGCEHAEGDAVFIVDPHCTFAPNALRTLAEDAIEHESISLPKLLIERRQRYGNYYGLIKLTKRGLQVQRSHKQRQYLALGGAMYMMSRSVLSKLKFMQPLPHWWGGYELFWSLVAYRFGIPIRSVECEEDCVHLTYRNSSTLPYSVIQHGRDFNEQWAMATAMPMFYSLWFARILAKRNKKTKMEPPVFDMYQQNMESWIRRDATMDESVCLQGPCRLKKLFNDELLRELLK